MLGEVEGSDSRILGFGVRGSFVQNLLEDGGCVGPPVEENRVLAARRANLVELLLFGDEVHLVGRLHDRRGLVILASLVSEGCSCGVEHV